MTVRQMVSLSLSLIHGVEEDHRHVHTNSNVYVCMYGLWSGIIYFSSIPYPGEVIFFTHTLPYLLLFLSRLELEICTHSLIRECEEYIYSYAYQDAEKRGGFFGKEEKVAQKMLWKCRHIMVAVVGMVLLLALLMASVFIITMPPLSILAFFL